MKKALFLLLTICSTFTLKALPIGNPAEPAFFHDHLFLCDGNWNSCFGGCLDIGVGYYGDFVYNRHLQLAESPEGTIARTKIFTNAGTLSLTWAERFKIYGLVGASRIAILSTLISVSPITGTTNGVGLFAETDVCWGAGARVLLWDCCNWKLGLEGEYFYTHPTVNSLLVQSAQYFYPAPARLKYQEWQVGSSLGYEVCVPECCLSFIPYIGLKWSQVRMNVPSSLTPFSGFENQENNRDWGWGFGLSAIAAQKISMTAEARFVDEKALFLQFLINF